MSHFVLHFKHVNYVLFVVNEPPLSCALFRIVPHCSAQFWIVSLVFCVAWEFGSPCFNPFFGDNAFNWNIASPEKSAGKLSSSAKLNSNRIFSFSLHASSLHTKRFALIRDCFKTKPAYDISVQSSWEKIESFCNDADGLLFVPS